MLAEVRAKLFTSDAIAQINLNADINWDGTSLRVLSGQTPCAHLLMGLFEKATEVRLTTSSLNGASEGLNA
jgi:hypothetical protein